MYVAAYLYAIPECEICIFSPSRRQSEKMLELVRTFLLKLPGQADRIEKSNRERLWIRGTHSAEDLRKVSSYPSKVSTLKGVGGDLMHVVLAVAAAACMYLIVMFAFPVSARRPRQWTRRCFMRSWFHCWNWTGRHSSAFLQSWIR